MFSPVHPKPTPQEPLAQKPPAHARRRQKICPGSLGVEVPVQWREKCSWSHSGLRLPSDGPSCHMSDVSSIKDDLSLPALQVKDLVLTEVGMG